MSIVIDTSITLAWVYTDELDFRRSPTFSVA